MRAPHQEGSFKSRVKYGYLNVGKVINGPKNLLNKLVYTMYPHQSKYIINSSFVTVIPNSIPPKGHCSQQTWKQRLMPCGIAIHR